MGVLLFIPDYPPIVALELTFSSPYVCCGMISFFISIRILRITRGFTRRGFYVLLKVGIVEKALSLRGYQ